LIHVKKENEHGRRDSDPHTIINAFIGNNLFLENHSYNEECIPLRQPTPFENIICLIHAKKIFKFSFFLDHIIQICLHV